ncbi:uncharacterized protein LOC123532640 [Mercenaria mercenaria]|uniref:uncharacterized protein LOC123532640 n=1 Tax=Mercenaria mercenaria TaxID=6596 RepID=UPI00234F12B2|nr:uncharacterized protein LOC123532640 [Mercenaria mercenaria]
MGMEDFKKVVAVVLAVFSVATALPEFHRFETHYGQNTIAVEKVEIDRDEQYAIVTVTALSGTIIPTVNFHDFAAGYTAIKDDKRERCYILKTAHTLEEMMNNFKQSVERNGFFQITQEFTCKSKEFIPNEELSERYGDRIANFCDDYEVVYSTQKYLKKAKRSVKMLSGGAMICGICLSLWCG